MIGTGWKSGQGLNPSFMIRLVDSALNWELCGSTHHLRGDFSALDEV